MNARRMNVGVAILACAMLLAMAAPAMAAESVTVNAEVDVNPYSIVLDEGETLDYGMLEPGGWGLPQFAQRIVVRNNGGAAVKLGMISTDASNGLGGTWELNAFEGADQFRWGVSGWMWYTIDDDTATTIAASLDAGDSAMFDSVVYMPTSTTQYGTYTWSGTIYASAP